MGEVKPGFRALTRTNGAHDAAAAPSRPTRDVPPPTEGESSTLGSATIARPEGTVSLGETVRIETDILSLKALRLIAADIAEKIARRYSGARLILADDAFLVGLRLHSLFTARVDLLEKELGRLRQELEGAPTTPTQAEPIAAFAAATGAVGAVAELLSYFKADTTYVGRQITFSDSTLQATLAGELIKKGLSVLLPHRFIWDTLSVAPDNDSIVKKINRLITLKGWIEHSPQTDEKLLERVKTLSAAVDAITAKVLEPDQDPVKCSLFELLLNADNIISSQDKSKSMLFMKADIVMSGGSYRTRRHLFTTLFTGDQLSYSGGAAVAYFVFDTADSNIVLSRRCITVRPTPRFSQALPSTTSGTTEACGAKTRPGAGVLAMRLVRSPGMANHNLTTVAGIGRGGRALRERAVQVITDQVYAYGVTEVVIRVVAGALESTWCSLEECIVLFRRVRSWMRPFVECE